MPHAVAAWRSTWSTPTPVRARTRSRGGAREKRGIDDRVGTDDRADCIGNIWFAWIGDKRNFIAEDAGD
jgi:hypothetical protein